MEGWRAHLQHRHAHEHLDNFKVRYYREMTYGSEMAGNYRSRAKQLRAMADIDREPKTADQLRNVAASYDAIAGKDRPDQPEAA